MVFCLHVTLKIHIVMFNGKHNNFENHLHSISSLVAQKIGVLRKYFRSCGDQVVLLKYFNYFIVPCFEYRFSVWSSAADSYLKSYSF